MTAITQPIARSSLVFYATPSDLTFVCTRTVFWRNRKIGRANIYSIGAAKQPLPTTKPIFHASLLPTELRFSKGSASATKMVGSSPADASVDRTALVIEPVDFNVWQQLQALNDRLNGAGGAAGLRRVAVATLKAITTEAEAGAGVSAQASSVLLAPFPIETIVPAMKGCKVFGAYYVPVVELKKVPKPAPSAPITGAAAPSSSLPRADKAKRDRAFSPASSRASAPTQRPLASQPASAAPLLRTTGLPPTASSVSAPNNPNQMSLGQKRPLPATGGGDTGPDYKRHHGGGGGAAAGSGSGRSRQ